MLYILTGSRELCIEIRHVFSPASLSIDKDFKFGHF